MQLVGARQHSSHSAGLISGSTIIAVANVAASVVRDLAELVSHGDERERGGGYFDLASVRRLVT